MVHRLGTDEQDRIFADVFTCNGLPSHIDPAGLDPDQFDPGEPRLAVELLRLGKDPRDDVLPTLSPAFRARFIALDPDAQPDPHSKTSWSVAELLDADFPEPEWLVPNLLPAVGLCSLCGRPKRGKSLMALQLAVAIGSGGMFLGHRLNKAPVLYLALEDHTRRLQERLRKMQAPRDCDIRFEREWPPLAKGRDEHLAETIANLQPGIVIVDTLVRLMAGSVIDWNDAGATTNLLAPLQALAFEGKTCILTIDHHTKGGLRNDDPIDDIMGSTSKSGVLDCALGLYKSQGVRGAKLKTRGRDVEDQEIALAFDPLTLCWQPQNGTEGPALNPLEHKVIESLDELGGDAELKEVCDHTGRDKAQVHRLLTDLINKGLVVQPEKRGPYMLVKSINGSQQGQQGQRESIDEYLPVD